MHFTTRKRIRRRRCAFLKRLRKIRTVICSTSDNNKMLWCDAICGCCCWKLGKFCLNVEAPNNILKNTSQLKCGVWSSYYTKHRVYREEDKILARIYAFEFNQKVYTNYKHYTVYIPCTYIYTNFTIAPSFNRCA